MSEPTEKKEKPQVTIRLDDDLLKRLNRRVRAEAAAAEDDPSRKTSKQAEINAAIAEYLDRREQPQQRQPARRVLEIPHQQPECGLAEHILAAAERLAEFEHGTEGQQAHYTNVMQILRLPSEPHKANRRSGAKP